MRQVQEGISKLRTKNTNWKPLRCIQSNTKFPTVEEKPFMEIYLLSQLWVTRPVPWFFASHTWPTCLFFHPPKELANLLAKQGTKSMSCRRALSPNHSRSKQRTDQRVLVLILTLKFLALKKWGFSCKKYLFTFLYASFQCGPYNDFKKILNKFLPTKT